jgi:protocatechuate 3,4-dioxygenase alpha subunit
MTEPGGTPSQTVGPYLALVLPWTDGSDVVAPGIIGAVTITGRLFDGAGDPIPDGLVETWQADPDGRFDHPDDPRGPQPYAGFRGFGRCPTDAAGRFTIHTLKPGAIPAGDGEIEAPHLDVSIFARGLLNRVVTRIYFPDETGANAADPVLSELADEDARALIAAPQSDGTLRFDIHLQGPNETPFFRV